MKRSTQIASILGALALTIALTSQVSAQTIPASWTSTGSPNGGVAGQSILLPSGKVLFAGGDLSRPQLYDPIAGTWSFTGGVDPGWVDFTATLLRNGKVLIAGGDIVSSPPRTLSRSAALYDPITGTSSPTGDLITARDGHTAVLLQNGKVLVVGGFDESSEFLDSAELYDPETGTWTSAGKLNVARYAESVTLLKDGKVLVAGGSNDDDFSSMLASAELYDPATGSWSMTGNLNLARADHEATLLPSGKVLISGGYRWPPVTLRSAELYDPTTGTWSVTGDLLTGRQFHTATLLPNGQVLVAGGETGIGAIPNWSTLALSSSELYDPGTETWTATASLNPALDWHTATLLRDGKVLVVGVADRSHVLSAQLYDSGVSAAPNQIDDPQFFVSQQYRDFLNREADIDGEGFWTSQIMTCGGDPQCVEVARINDSAAFYLSIEFQQTGYLVYRMYKAAYGNMPDTPVPIKFDEFLANTQEIGNGVVVLQPGWETTLENNKQAFAADFVQRSRFTSAYPDSLTAGQFVDALNNNAGNPLSQMERDQLVSDLSLGMKSRADVLRAVAENQNLAAAEFNRAFVLMQYFGYLRRNPNDAPDGNFNGYNFWLDKLNQFNGDFVGAEMVKAFLDSSEYRQRFGP